MTRQDVFDLLRAEGIPFEITEHPAAFNMEDMKGIPLPYPEADAKNLFVRDDKRRAYYLISVRGDKRVDLKAFRRAHGTRTLSFASEAELLSILGLTPGSVTPLGLLNDGGHRTALYIDRDLWDGRIGCHPLDNTATLWLMTADLIRLLSRRGVSVFPADL